MTSRSLKPEPAHSDIGIYECEIRLTFRLIEEKKVLADRENLLDILLDAISCGTDEYLEMRSTEAQAREFPETEASADMRRQIIRLRNSKLSY